MIVIVSMVICSRPRINSVPVLSTTRAQYLSTKHSVHGNEYTNPSPQMWTPQKGSNSSILENSKKTFRKRDYNKFDREQALIKSTAENGNLVSVGDWATPAYVNMDSRNKKESFQLYKTEELTIQNNDPLKIGVSILSVLQDKGNRVMRLIQCPFDTKSEKCQLQDGRCKFHHRIKNQIMSPPNHLDVVVSV